MLGKQWLNRYATTNVRGTTIERGHIRQRKLDGVVTWYFDHVMESLPSMLQAALLLLGCALSLPLANQYRHRIRRPWRHFVWCHLLPFDRRCRGGFRELSISNSGCTCSSPCSFTYPSFSHSEVHQKLLVLSHAHQVVEVIKATPAHEEAYH